MSIYYGYNPQTWSPPAAEDYKCSDCGKSGRRLWAAAYVYDSSRPAYCAHCLRRHTSAQVDAINEETVNIGWFVPAVPGDNGWIDHLRIPDVADKWWLGLPAMVTKSWRDI